MIPPPPHMSISGFFDVFSAESTAKVGFSGILDENSAKRHVKEEFLK